MTTAPAYSSAIRWYLNRLRCMSPGEIGYRAYQKFVARLQRSGLAIVSTVPSPDVGVVAHDFVGIDAKVEPAPYLRAADKIAQGKMRVFSQEYEFGPLPQWNRDPKTGTVAPRVFGKTLDYRNEALVGDIKYLWEPNRHLQLVTLAQAYRLGQDRRYLDALQRQLDSWFKQCPYLEGPNWTSSLELAIRLINWSIVWQLIGGLQSPVFAGVAGERFRRLWLDSIYRHMHFIHGHLSRFSSANNHLIGELAGLFVGAVTWPYWPRTTGWRDSARHRLEREALKQNTQDGVNREQAISYQQFVLDFLLLAGSAGRANGKEFSADYWQRVEAMLEFIASVMDVGGNVPMIGDADDGYVVRLSQMNGFCPYRSLLATGAILFARGDFKAKAGPLDDKTQWLMGALSEAKYRNIDNRDKPLPARRDFRQGGYYILGCDFESDREIRLLADAGPVGYLSIAAHGHADALAFVLSVRGKEILIDPGTYAYHTKKQWRDYFRGTTAHNTVVVDGEHQSVIGGNFMWLGKANASCDGWEPGDRLDRFIGSHDGYRRLPDPVIHRREIVLDKDERRVVVNDALECKDRHSVRLFWHFSEECEVVEQNGTVVARNGGVSVKLSMPGSQAELQLVRGREEPPLGWVSRAFDCKIPTTTAVACLEISGRSTLSTELVCD